MSLNPVLQKLQAARTRECVMPAADAERLAAQSRAVDAARRSLRTDFPSRLEPYAKA